MVLIIKLLALSTLMSVLVKYWIEQGNVAPMTEYALMAVTLPPLAMAVALWWRYDHSS